MIEATLNVEKIFWENKIFDSDEITDNNYWKTIKNLFLKENIDLSTPDINLPEKADIIIDFNVPKNFNDFGNKRYLIQYESEITLKRNWNPKYLNKYRLIFSWYDTNKIDKKFVKINYPQLNLIDDTNYVDYSDKKLCTLIASNKFYQHKKELYSERLEAIRWFEKNSPECFDLYGYDWDKFRFEGILSVFNNYLELINIPCVCKYSTYRGPISFKLATLRKYKFSICYENAIDLPGYITEKIFDCFYAGNVPIYLGAPNISKWIPKKTFIDKRDFCSYEDLYEFLINMDKAEYDLYLYNIEEFLKSPDYYLFTSSHFADVISKNIIKDFKNETKHE